MTSQMKKHSDELLQHALEVFELERNPSNKRESKNAEVVHVLESAQEYYKMRKDANEALGKSYFKLALAQKNSIHKLGVDDMREEILPTFRIKSRGEEYDDNANDNTSMDLDSLSLLSGLPSIEMRRAQREFKKALRLLVRSAYAATDIGEERLK